MNKNVYDVLNRLLTIEYRSLPIYLNFACPWTHRGDEQALSTVRRVAEDNQQRAGRIAQFILGNYGPTEMGEYPIEFLDMHDLSLDFLVTKLVEYQKCDVQGIEQCVKELRGDRPAEALAEEALGAARGHLETFEELAGQLARQAS